MKYGPCSLLMAEGLGRIRLTREQVWDNDLSAKKTSTAKSAGLLPDEFNQEGNDWLTNAKKRIVSYQLDIIMAAWANLYPNFFSQYVHGVKR